MSPKPPPPVSDIALFRFSVVSEVRARVARGEVRSAAVRTAARRTHVGPDGRPRKVGVRSIYRWLAAYETDGIAGLENKPRTTSTDGVLEPALVTFLVQQKAEDPVASVPELLRRAVVVGLLSSTGDVDRVTAWRALKRRGVDTRRRARARDQRRFSKAHRNQLVLCDGKHFRAGPKRNKRVALFFIDDATRYIPEVVVGTRETAELFLRGLYRLLRAVGRIDAIYMDNGSGFIAGDSREVSANLGIGHILGTEGYPEGRGKIERFNRTVKADVLRHLATEGIDPACTALELRLSHYLRTDYNVRTHEGLAKGETPRARYLADDRPLRPIDDAELRRHFFVGVERTVTSDHVVSIDSRDWEVPRGLAGERLTVRQDVFDRQRLLLEHEGRVLRLQEVDVVANADGHRGRQGPPPDTTETTTAGAAIRAADAALAPITQPDGGFAVTDEE